MLHALKSGTSALLSINQKTPSKDIWRRGVTILLLACVAGVCHSIPSGDSDPKADRLLDRMPPLFSHDRPKRALSKQDQLYAEAALTQWLEAYLHREYAVADKRFFWTPRGYTTWAAVSNGTGLRVSEVFGRKTAVDVPWQEMGLDLAEIWKVQYEGETRYFSVAMTDQPVPGTRGRRLVGYFELTPLNLGSRQHGQRRATL